MSAFTSASGTKPTAMADLSPLLGEELNSVLALPTFFHERGQARIVLLL
jgi:hypothetical protein